MKGNKGSFSTIRGTLCIFFFLVVFFVYPLVFNNGKVEFSSGASPLSNQIQNFPLETQLTVFRISGNSQGKARKSRTTLKELVANGSTPILVNFWATWCPPCLEELPSIEMLSKQLNDKSTGTPWPRPQLITISVDDRLEDIAKLESTLDFKPSFTVLHDKEGELARSMGTTKFPETYLISPQGKILYKWLGPQDWLSADALKQINRHLQ